MDIDALTSRRAKLIAGIFALAYIIIQIFQSYVFSHLPETHSLGEELLRGADPLNIWRALLLILSFYGLMYVFLVICAENMKDRFTLSVFALIGLVIFCFIEICYRSIELFFFQLHLPALFQQSPDPNEQKRLLEMFSTFQTVQYALYFPLLFSQAIGSAVLSLTFKAARRINCLITIAFGLNFIRLVGRILGMYLHITTLNSFSGTLYLPFVVVIFGLISAWLLMTQRGEAVGHSQGAG